MLPYDTVALFALMARYNATWWPVVLVLLGLGGAALALAWRRRGHRLIAVVLAAGWLWVGAVYHLQHMATLNFMAPLYGVVWLVQGAALSALAVTDGWRAGTAPALCRRAGLALALIALFGFPLAARWSGAPWAAVPLVGTAPDPTAVFTIAILLTGTGRALPLIWLVPVAWAVVAGLSAHLLRFWPDLLVPLAALGAVLALARRRR